MVDRKIWISITAVLLALLAFSGAVDQAGNSRTEDALLRALATYGIARALNGVISVAQGTEVAIEPAGVGVILTPGQILDPVNDLVERFSWVMLVSSASLGVLNVLLSISAWIWLSILLAICLTGLVYIQWRPQASGLSRIIVRLSVVLIILRFAAPVIAISNDLIYWQFLDSGYQEATSGLQQTTQRITAISLDETRARNPASAEDTLLDKAKALYESTAQSIRHQVDMQQRMQRYQQAASNASRHAIDLIVIFIFQTILLPIVFIWLVWHAVKWALFGRSFIQSTGSR